MSRDRVGSDSKVVRKIPNVEKREISTATSRVETLKRRDLLSYFKKIEREFRREISSVDEDYKSSSTDLKNSERQHKHHDIKKKSSSATGRSKKKLKWGSSEKIRKKSNSSENCVYCPFNKKSRSRESVNFILRDPRKVSEDNCWKSADQIRSSSSKNNNIETREFSRKFDGRTSKRDITNSEERNINCRCASGSNLKNKLGERSDVSDSVNEEFVQHCRLFPIKDDLDSSDLLQCEEQLKREENDPRSDNFNKKERSRSRSTIPDCRRSANLYLSLPNQRGQFSSTPKQISLNPKTKIDASRHEFWFVSKSPALDHDTKPSDLERGRPQKSRRFFDLERGEANLSRNRAASTKKNSANVCSGTKKAVPEKLCKLTNTSRRKDSRGCPCEAEVEKRERASYRCPENVDNYDRPKGCPRYRGSCKTRESARKDNPENDAENLSVEAFQRWQNWRRNKIHEGNCTCGPFQTNLDERVGGSIFPKLRSRANGKITGTSPARNGDNLAFEGEETRENFRGIPHFSSGNVVRAFNGKKYYDPYIDRNQLSDGRRGAGKSWENVTEDYNKLTLTSRTPRRERTRPKTCRGFIRTGITRTYPFADGFPLERTCPSKHRDSNFCPPRSRNTSKKSNCDCKELYRAPPAVCRFDSCTCTKLQARDARRDYGDAKKDLNTTCCSSPSLSRLEERLDRKLESFCEMVRSANSQANVDRSKTSSFPRCSEVSCRDDHCQLDPKLGVQELWRSDKSSGRSLDPTNVRVARESCRKTNLKKVLIYPPRGEPGPPLTLYKLASNINCKVKGDARTGLRYNVTYVQKFVSPPWRPGDAAEKSFFQGTANEWECSSGYG